MKKLFKIFSILVMVFVLFSCANPSSDSISGSQPSNPEEPTYSITFIAEKYPEDDKPIADLLNRLDTYNKVEKGKEVKLPTIIYETISGEYEIDEPKDLNVILRMNYEGNVTSVVVKNENIEIKFWTTPAE